MTIPGINLANLLGNLSLDNAMQNTKNTKVKKHFKEKRKIKIQQIKKEQICLIGERFGKGVLDLRCTEDISRDLYEEISEHFPKK